jgi:F0F1-type ATP synthase membrane subunit b/b'
MNATIELAALIIQMAFLAIVLSVVGFYANKIINKVMLSRHAYVVKSNAEVARARAYARAQA